MRSLRGQGSYGAVYQVEPVEGGKDTPFALKLALHAGDPRFEREAELLSRLHHPNVPRLQARGHWAPREGGLFPYLVMEWVEGVSLYDWAGQRTLTSRQVLRLLTQVARALEATHAVGGVHRDVKGDNLLVQAQGHVMLMDFGSGNYRGAPELTRQLPPPGTPAYYSPESLRFQWEHRRHAVARYEAQPADDVYALGVTAYRLVTGRYPEALEMEPEGESFRPVPPKWVPLESDTVNPCPELAALIQRMLADEPSDRGSARDIARALERAAKTARAQADQPIHRLPSSLPVAPPRPSRRARPAWGLALAVGMGLMMWAGRALWEDSSVSRRSEGQHEGTVGLADAGLEASGNEEPMIREIGRDMPKKPLPGQRRPPCGKHASEINGGCWSRSDTAVPPCGDELADWKGACYWPILKLPFPATSDTP
ncbi:serine/threonine-protein kinase [Stigmatella erecta]|uniref:Serine/threonine protein kinase n=1 Tax=Stigmatella erecta TaxID=83460 RepID=A0A1I0HCS8_9BACT|nr:serine/threonine-protein kinase [Stigmatella erecta]SET80660.1 Serine/threonine protein kinase [Stigmatella erecta]